MDERWQPCSPEGEEARAPWGSVCPLSSATWASSSASPSTGCCLFLRKPELAWRLALSTFRVTGV